MALKQSQNRNYPHKVQVPSNKYTSTTSVKSDVGTQRSSSTSCSPASNPQSVQNNSSSGMKRKGRDTQPLDLSSKKIKLDSASQG